MTPERPYYYRMCMIASDINGFLLRGGDPIEYIRDHEYTQGFWQELKEWMRRNAPGQYANIPLRRRLVFH